MDKSQEKRALRKQLVEQRLNMPDRLLRSDLLQEVLRVWLVGRGDIVIGAYWPIKGEFDALPALYRWKEAANCWTSRTAAIGLPVIDRLTQDAAFHLGSPVARWRRMRSASPSPRTPTCSCPPAVRALRRLRPGGFRLGYGGGF